MWMLSGHLPPLDDIPAWPLYALGASFSRHERNIPYMKANLAPSYDFGFH